MKPCPFCEAESEYLRIVPAWNVGVVERYAIVCDNCSARGPVAGDKDEVVKRWNWACRWEEVQRLVKTAQRVNSIYRTNSLADALAPFEADDV